MRSHTSLLLALLLFADPMSARDECASLSSDAAALVLHAAYYPYPAKLRIHLDTAPMRAPDRPEDGTLQLLGPDGAALLTQAISLPHPDQPHDLRLDLPPLAEGTHRVALTVSSKRCGRIAGPSQTFEHRTFGWERNDLGRSPTILPPLRPLKTRMGVVEAVGRRYRYPESGLWSQVHSLDAPLLAAPLRLEAVVDGRPHALKVVRPAAVVDSRPEQVEISSALRAGRLSIEQRQRFEVDGLVTFELELRGKGARLERLDLVIPLRPEHSTLLNAVTDGTLHHQLGATPKGSGVVWDSRRVPRRVLPEGFLPYIWLGNEERGLAWAGESTRDWLVDHAEPTHLLRRTQNATELVVRFVTRPARLDRMRRISFAMQATPTKPRPADWRRWLLDCERFPGARRICALGSGYYWGTDTPFGDLVPLGDDRQHFDDFAAARRQGLSSEADILGWLFRHPVLDRGMRKVYRDSLAYTFRAMEHQPDQVIPYVNAHGSAPTAEYQVYVDEWHLVPFGDRTGRNASQHREIKVQSTQSFHDYMLWHLDRLLDSEAFDGFFFDNTFLLASYDDVAGSAYVDDHGELVPGVDLFGLRDLFRRAQTLVHARRGGWYNLLHMTTTPIAPVHGWAGMTLDGEWRYGDTPFPERFPASFLRAASLGSQTGTVPLYLHGIGSVPRSQLPELERQLAAWLAVHEIRVWRQLRGPLELVWRELFDAGYARPDCRVERYWDDDRNFEIQGADAVALLVACEGRALALVANAGGPATARLRVDASALGLGTLRECRDRERRSGVEQEGNDACQVTLARHGMRLVELRGTKP